MKCFLFVFGLVLGLVLATAASASAQEWQKIFDGKTLKGWEGSAHWVVKDDAISGVITKDTLDQDEHLPDLEGRHRRQL